MNLSDELRGASRIIWHRQAIGSFIEPPPISTVAIDCAADELDRLTSENDELFQGREDFRISSEGYRRELDRLTSALPKTADGVTIVPGMEVFVWMDADLWHGPVLRVGGNKHSHQPEDDVVFEWDFIHGAKSGYNAQSKHCYSTREAAEEAAKTNDRTE